MEDRWALIHLASTVEVAPEQGKTASRWPFSGVLAWQQVARPSACTYVLWPVRYRECFAEQCGFFKLGTRTLLYLRDTCDLGRPYRVVVLELKSGLPFFRGQSSPNFYSHNCIPVTRRTIFSAREGAKIET